MRSLRVAASLSILFLSLHCFSPRPFGAIAYLPPVRQDVDGTRYLPLYEYLNFSVGDASNDAVSFHAGGWYRYDLRNESFGTKSTGDLQYAY